MSDYRKQCNYQCETATIISFSLELLTSAEAFAVAYIKASSACEHGYRNILGAAAASKDLCISDSFQH